jgi:hypothetical protein
VVAGVAATLVVGAYLVFAIWLVPTWVGNSVYSSKPEAEATARASERGSVRTAMLAVLAGGIAAVGAVYTARTYALNKRETERTFELTRRGQLTERFTSAVDQLGQADKLDVRLGGIYALEQIARESAEEHGPIMEVLCAYVRSHSPAATRPADQIREDMARSYLQAMSRVAFSRPDEHSEDSDDPTGNDMPQPLPPELAEQLDDGEEPLHGLSVDIQAVLTILARRRADHDKEAGVRLDLSGADLRRVTANGLRAERADLVGANLLGAKLFDASLQRAVLAGANLQRANLGGATCRGRLLLGANLQGAILRGADLQGAKAGRFVRRDDVGPVTRWPDNFASQAAGVMWVDT